MMIVMIPTLGSGVLSFEVRLYGHFLMWYEVNTGACKQI